MPKIKTFKCPEVKLPDTVGRKKILCPSSSSAHGRFKSHVSEKEERADFERYSSEVKKLGNSTLKGLQAMKVKADVLTELGVPPPKQQKIPFKMAVGIMNGRERRKEKFLKKVKESGQVIAKSLVRKNPKKRTREESDRGLDANIKGGVLRINKRHFKNS